MKKQTEIVQKIERQYVGDDCVQIMIPYRNAITILSQDGMLYHHKPGSDVYINKYLEDERRKQFPYSNIPTHYSRVGMFKKMTYANQLLEFEKPYFRVGDGLFLESFAVKDNNSALLINSIMQPDKHIEHMTYAELLQLVSKRDSDEQTFYVYLDGSINPDGEELFPTEERIYNYISNRLTKNLRDFEKEESDYNSSIGAYLRDNPWFLRYIGNSLKDINFSSIDFNIRIGYDASLLIVRINKGVMTIQGIEVAFVKKDDYRVEIYDIPITKYSLEQLKHMPKINVTKEPRIPLRLNPGVTRQDIKEAKQMVKTLRQ